MVGFFNDIWNHIIPICFHVIGVDPLQFSCLENPMDEEPGGAAAAAVMGCAEAFLLFVRSVLSWRGRVCVLSCSSCV